ncbi:uncharacterized protein LOC9643762 [Selaginella moellendorffii]|uniref:uncharacterized protein LOC9643762 n=1 Tax=Selaginella moellendorffii TaxID=88036 RepID=UPI000D1D0CE0|nr:uncharacterized protein LOC9643762 [Selaginella moellendorffii]|eukprot:XP_024523549.1 uncharacterized protein LOC9643762 [Selaginella moellendorffii]
MDSSSLRSSCLGFRVPCSRSRCRGSRVSFGARCEAPRQLKEERRRTPPTANASVPVRMVWYLSEAFGIAAAGLRNFQSGLGKSQGQEQEEGDFEVVTREMACDLIRKDYEQSYFVTGKMTTGIYKSDCEFADPFVSFKGLKRFKQNVSNLGAFMKKSTLKIASWDEKEDSLKVGWRFRCVLALPWRPAISASGSTEYFFDDESGKICKHVESWNISPADGVRQLFKPSKAAKS